MNRRKRVRVHPLRIILALLMVAEVVLSYRIINNRAYLDHYLKQEDLKEETRQFNVIASLADSAFESVVSEPVQTSVPIQEPEVVEEPVHDYQWYLDNENGTNSDLDVMARIIFAEGGNQSEECMTTIGGTVINRVNDPQFPDSIYEVVYQSRTFESGKTIYQFSPVGSGSIDNLSSEKAYNVAVKIISGDYECRSDIIAFESCGPDEYSHSSWADYAFTIGDMAFYSKR